MAEQVDNEIVPAALLGVTDTGPTADVGWATPATVRTMLNVADGATRNASDVALRDRGTHTGTQPTSTIDGLDTALSGKAALNHSHTQSDIVGLVADLLTKAPLTTHAESEIVGLTDNLATKAPLASPVFTGTPSGPTPATADSSSRFATTAMVQAALATVSAGTEYLGTWNASTNTPTLSSGSGTGNPGGFYVVSVAGSTSINGIASWAVGDWIISDQVGWKKIAQTNAVASVFGRTGTITASPGDYNAGQITETATGKIMTDAERTKLAGVATGATANATDAALRDRTTHTGAQAISTVTGLQTALDAKAPLASPALTGTPTAPTAAAGTSTTQLASTAFVQQELGGTGNHAFKSIAVTGQSQIDAESPTDTLTIVAGTNISIVTTPSTDTLTINATSGGGGAGLIDVISGQIKGAVENGGVYVLEEDVAYGYTINSCSVRSSTGSGTVAVQNSTARTSRTCLRRPSAPRE